MKNALVAVAIAAVAVPVAVLLMYGGTGIPGEVYRRIKVRDHSSEKPGIGHLI